MGDSGSKTARRAGTGGPRLQQRGVKDQARGRARGRHPVMKTHPFSIAAAILLSALPALVRADGGPAQTLSGRGESVPRRRRSPPHPPRSPRHRGGDHRRPPAGSRLARRLHRTGAGRGPVSGRTAGVYDTVIVTGRHVESVSARRFSGVAAKAAGCRSRRPCHDHATRARPFPSTASSPGVDA